MVLSVFLAALIWTVTGQSTASDGLWHFVNILCQQRNRSSDGSFGDPMQSAGGTPSSLLMPLHKVPVGPPLHYLCHCTKSPWLFMTIFHPQLNSKLAYVHLF